jgi:hypothetical protein
VRVRRRGKGDVTPPGGRPPSSTRGLCAAIIVVLVPLLARSPELAGRYVADPMSRYSGLVTRSEGGTVAGRPELDPNTGFTAQALGRRAADTWLEGEVPWWNPHEGVGAPLAGEMQSAAFFPLVFLQLLPNGQLLISLILQILAGLGTYLLLRRLPLSHVASASGGILFGFNGALAWLTHAPANPVPFLPLLLLGVELSLTESAERRGALGALLIAVSLGLSLVAGFPETAYLNGLLVALWTALRFFPAENKLGFAARIGVGLGLGLALAGPVLVAFLEYLREADVGSHQGGLFANDAISPQVALQLFLPYVFGPPGSDGGRNLALANAWGQLGGYLSILVAFAAAGGVVGKNQRALRILLAGWTVLAAARGYGVPGATQICNLFPFVKDVAWYRYSPASWELATAVLAAFAIDDVRREPRWRTLRRHGAAMAVLLGLCAFLWVNAGPVLHDLRGATSLTGWRIVSLAWPLGAFVLVAAAACFRQAIVRASALAAVLCLDAVVLFMIPRFSAPTRVEYGGLAGVKFLQDNLGLQRFYTLGPIAPNYGSFFGIASLNHNDLPIASRWTRFIHEHLEPHGDPTLFIGTHYYDKHLPSPQSELQRNLEWYEWAGVKYVVRGGDVRSLFPDDRRARLVHRDAAMSIFELPNPRPYFEVTKGACTLSVRSRTSLDAACVGPAELVRRELFFPGWSAASNGAPLPIEEHGDLFQRISLPGGTNEIQFSYRPVHARLALWGFVLGFIGLALCLTFTLSAAPAARP